MKKLLVSLAIILMGVVQSLNAQNETDYSLEGIGKTLSKFKVVQIGKFHDGLAWIWVEKGIDNSRNGDQWFGYIDKKGKLVIPCDYEYAGDFSEGLACVSKSWKYGFIDKQGNVVIPIEHENQFGNFSDGLAKMKIESDKYCYINKQGDIVINNVEGEAGDFQNGIAPVSNFGFYAIDKTGKKLFPKQQYLFQRFIDDYFLARDENRKYGALDTHGNIAISFKCDGIGYSEGYFLVYEDSEKGWKYINTKGEVVISDVFDDAKPFSDEYAAVKKGDKWGYINKQGEIIIPMQYDRAYDFINGYAFIKNFGKGCAIIDKHGSQVVPFTDYSDFDPVSSEGLYVVEKDGKRGYADVYGNSTFNPKANSALSKAASHSNTNDLRAEAKTIMSTSTKPTAAQFIGGESAMRRFIASTMRYPARAAENGIQGTVTVVFTVEEDGSLTNIRLKRPVARYLNEEALRIVSKMPKWQPAQSGGVNVKSEQSVEVSFRLQ